MLFRSPYPCHVLSLETGEPHPLAKHGLLSLTDDGWMDATASARIQGDVAGFVNGGRLSLSNWQTGEQLLVRMFRASLPTHTSDRIARRT
jgi:hypothetical protein